MGSYRLLTLMLSSCLLTACVDSKYDLGNVNTDDVTLGNAWVAPLGVGTVTSEEVVDVEKVPSITTDDEGAYVARYSGMLEERKSALRASGSRTLVASVEVETGDLNSLFDGDFTLALTDPHIRLDATEAPATPVDCRLKMTSYGSTETFETFSDFPFSQATPKTWIGPIAPDASWGYHFVENTEMPKLVSVVPSHISLDLLADEDQVAQLPEGTFSKLHYQVELPFIPAAEFRATSVERIEDAFDEEFVDYIFSDGSATIYGEVTNSMPFDVTVELVIVDQNNNPLDITFPQQTVSGEKGEVSFEITEEDMPKMEMARHIDLKLHLSGREQAASLKTGQAVTFSLKLKKEGGISI